MEATSITNHHSAITTASSPRVNNDAETRRRDDAAKAAEHFIMNTQGPKFENQTAVDFVVIGAGAAGGIVAKELSEAGFEVVVLEQGPYLKERDFNHDEIKHMQQSYLSNDWKKQPNTFRRTSKQKAKVQPAIIYGRMVGGGTAHFTANYWRFHEIDFVERTKLGTIDKIDFVKAPVVRGEMR